MEILFFDETNSDIVLEYSKSITNELTLEFENYLDKLNNSLFNNEVIGVKIKNKLVSIEIINKSSNSIDFIFVDKNYRNKGIASAMISVALRVLELQDGIKLKSKSTYNMLNKFLIDFGFNKIKTENGNIMFEYK